MEAKAQKYSIPEIDSALSRIVHRLHQIKNDLHDGIYGESPKETDSDKTELPTPSLSSMERRVEDIYGELNQIETYISKIHEKPQSDVSPPR